ncbi:uncharacterized protein LOC109537138 [Dendroctonus ponderosae]|uniref:uncharacterized protein LOC109537138 n=1 Tax=Dendroctonus ponderosae TaxID=77166 RepID=UPI0020356125|nr:uncharacterized protein LOC109537138 [Dendroctonus ponderosae]KAH1018212.1 hypothetical protein HUJ05_006024 [Dendroctonus ponderosae]
MEPAANNRALPGDQKTGHSATMKLLVLVVIFCASARANCGCLKCSKHLETLQVPGPDGLPVKIIFSRPAGNSCNPPSHSLPAPVPLGPSTAPSTLPLSYEVLRPGGRPKGGLKEAEPRELRFRVDRVLTRAAPSRQACTRSCCQLGNKGRSKRQLRSNWLADTIYRNRAPPTSSRFWRPTAPRSRLGQRGATEASLLQKLQRLNHNPTSKDLEGQATAFLKHLLQPPRAQRRPKRTIVVGSDELDLPAHYKVDINSEESEQDDDYQEAPAPMVGGFPRPYPGRRLFPPADSMLGRSAIHTVVRQELEAHQKKLDREQRMKRVGLGVPHNPFYLLLTAPMQFLDHFRRGGTPLTALPKVVHTAKRCFKDLGQNLHKHCLNLASNVIGDFDHVQVLDHLSGRYRREAPPEHLREKRYVLKVVNEDDIQQEVEDYLAAKMDHQFSFLRPLQDCYDKVGELLANEGSRPQVKLTKLQPRLIIDNRGLPFMEYDGLKRPLRLNSRRGGPSRFRPRPGDASAEETTSRIASLLVRARQDPEVVGSGRNDLLPPTQVVKERISALLEEVDQLVQLDPENYDQLFELLIRLQQVKTSIEQEWKRLIMDNKLEDMAAKLEILSKLKELQHLKNESVRSIAATLKKTDNEFVRKQLIHSLVRLQKLQCVVSSVVEDCEQHLKTRTPFNEKKEVKYVDTLVELKFVYSKSRSDLVEKLGQDRDQEVQVHMETLRGLKKLLVKADQEQEKFDQAAKLLWEMGNLEKLLKQTVKELSKKLGRSYRIRKELRILFDLQRRFEECEGELGGLLGSAREHKKTPPKRDVKDMVAQIRRRHEEALQRAKAKLKPS